MVINYCLVVIILYIVVCVCYAVCKWKETTETKLAKKTLNFVIDAVFCPIKFVIKVFKKKIAPEPVVIAEVKKPRKKKG
jgi:ascorbate-specific PTS system EIIC-type component UlaA